MPAALGGGVHGEELRVGVRLGRSQPAERSQRDPDLLGARRPDEGREQAAERRQGRLSGRGCGRPPHRQTDGWVSGDVNLPAAVLHLLQVPAQPRGGGVEAVRAVGEEPGDQRVLGVGAGQQGAGLSGGQCRSRRVNSTVPRVRTTAVTTAMKTPACRLPSRYSVDCPVTGSKPV